MIKACLSELDCYASTWLKPQDDTWGPTLGDANFQQVVPVVEDFLKCFNTTCQIIAACSGMIFFNIVYIKCL